MGHASLDDMKHAVKNLYTQQAIWLQSLTAFSERFTSVPLQTMPTWQACKGITATQDKGSALRSLDTPLVLGVLGVTLLGLELYHRSSTKTAMVTSKVAPNTGRLTAMTTAR